MSEIAVPALTTTVRRSHAIALSWVRYIGFALLGVELIGFLAWSAILYNRYSLTYDYSIYHQAWYLIAHGNFDPYDTIQRFPFWRNHGELIFWPLALLYWVWPHDLMLLWVQDFATVAAEAVTFTWLCEMAAKRRTDTDAAWLAAAGLVALVANPWIWQTVSWDYHTEPLTTLLLLLVIRDLARGRRRVWAWVAPLLLCGDVAGTYLIGVGIGTAVANRQSRMRGIAVACVGAVAFVAIATLHANLGSGHGLEAYAYLAGAPIGTTLTMGTLIKGVLTHPLSALRTLASKTTDMWANLAPPGFLGICFVALLPVIVIVLLANNLWPGLLFSAPGFQNFPLYMLMPAGTVGVLAWLHQRHRAAALVLSCLVVAQALVWTGLWAPRIPGNWLRVPDSAATTLAATQALIPSNAAVIASQGIAGRFSGRSSIIPLMGPGLLKVHGQTWFVIAPTIGIETESTASAMAFIGELAGPLGATLVTHVNGVWVFRWLPPAGTTSVSIPGDSAPIEAWTSAGVAGRPALSGPVSDWHAESTGAYGYVTDQLAWQMPTGRYVAEVTLATSGPVNVEVWDDTGNVLLARHSIATSGGIERVTLPVDALTPYPASSFSGFGPFHADFIAPPAGQRLEVRVWSPGNTFVSVYNADLSPAPATRAS
jgi:uncharacterized membrane protein